MSDANTTITNVILTPKNFPSDVLKWMKINATPRMSLKLMQVCKYFQHKKFPYFVVKYAYAYKDDAIILDVGKKEREVKNLENLPNNLWLRGRLRLYYGQGALHQILKNFVVCDIRRIDFMDQKMTFDEFKLLTSSGKVTSVYMAATDITFKNGYPVPLENILHYIPKANRICFDHGVPNYHFVKGVEYPKLRDLTLMYIKENMNVEDFTKFMIENQRIKYTLIIDGSVPPEYAARVINCNNQIVKAWKGRRPTPQFLISQNQIQERFRRK